ncbi:hypothetical protein J3459_016558 [Metarhizium acridum]|nr:hypothetical protein J3459_016558 [Metarhizium acridum]
MRTTGKSRTCTRRHLCQQFYTPAEKAREKLFYKEETEPCYVWVIFDLDTLDVGQDIQCLEHNKPRVRQLGVEIEEDEDVLLESPCQNLCSFEKLVGCRVTVDGLFVTKSRN